MVDKTLGPSEGNLPRAKTQAALKARRSRGQGRSALNVPQRPATPASSYASVGRWRPN